MAALGIRISKLEGALGADDIERRVRSLSDEQLDAEIARLDEKARHCLEERGVRCADMPITDVLARLEAFANAKETQ